MSIYAQDTLYSQINLTAANNTFELREDPGGIANDVRVTLNAGAYWAHNQSAFDAFRQGFWTALLDVLNNGSGVLGTRVGTPNQSYTIGLTTPSSTTLANTGIVLTSDSAVTTFRIRWSTGTMDARIFGQLIATPADTDSSAGSPNHRIISPGAAKYRFVTQDLGSGQAIDKKPIPWKITRRSSELPKDARTLTWGQGIRRAFLYEDIPAAFVLRDRADEAEFASPYGLATGDKNATWYDVWDAYTRGDEVIIVHNVSSSLSVSLFDYEVTKLWQDTTFGQFADRMPGREGGDYYRVEFVAAVDPSFENYPH